MKIAMRARVFPMMIALGILFLSAACASYQAKPLPDAEIAAESPGPDLQQLKVGASELQHPLLHPLVINLDDGLSPAEAAVLAVLANPDLIALRDTHDEAAAQLIGAGVLPNPDFSGAVDHPYGSGSEGTGNALNLSLGVDLGRFRGRAARIAEASDSLKAVDLGIAWQEWQVAQAARLKTLRVGMLKKRCALLADQVADETATVKTLSAAVEEGDVTISDLGIHEAAREGLLQQESELRRDMATERSGLLALLGLAPDSEIRFCLDGAEDFPGLPSREELVRAALRQRLDLRALELGYEAEEERVREAISQQFPSISIGISSSKDETALKFLGGFISLGLPIFDRSQGEIALQRATRNRLRHEYEARVAAIRAECSHLLEQDELIGSQLAKNREGIGKLSVIEKTEAKGLASGDVDRLAWQQLKSTLSDLRQQELALVQARLESRFALETVVGGFQTKQHAAE